MIELEQMREVHLLQDRVELLGSVPPGQVGDVSVCDRTMRLVVSHLLQQVLNRGQIYLSTSLTEAFGSSIIEAASTGLFIVSTKVGGVPEVLPEDMIEFARPDADGESFGPPLDPHVLTLLSLDQTSSSRWASPSISFDRKGTIPLSRMDD